VACPIAIAVKEDADEDMRKEIAISPPYGLTPEATRRPDWSYNETFTLSRLQEYE
jgi:hypothetical protein